MVLTQVASAQIPQTYKVYALKFAAANVNALQRQNGEAYTATQSSGVARVDALNSNGAGALVVGSTESSNVDIASQLSQLIVAQQAYGANAKVISAANELMTTTVNIKQ